MKFIDRLTEDKAWRLKVVGGILVFILFYIAVINYFDVFFARFPVPFQWVSVTMVGYIALASVFGLALSDNFVRKTIGIIFMTMAIDNITPPMLLSLSGVMHVVDLSTATTTALLHYLWSLTGLSGIGLWVLVYPVSTIILVIFAVLILNYEEVMS